MANADGAAPDDGRPAKSSLPVVQAPKLDGSDEDIGHESAGGSFRSARSSSRSRSLRFAMLAAALAVAAALGSMIGALSAAKLTNVATVATTGSVPPDAHAAQTIKAQLAELSALKTNLETATRNANSQFAKIADRLDHVEHASIEPAVKLAHIADAVDRLEKHAAAAPAPAPATALPAPETTGSIASNQPPAPSSAQEAKQNDHMLQDWVIRDARAGRAMVANRYSGVFEAIPGSVLPGLGRVEAIKRQDGQWVVVTAHGMITAR